MAGGIRFIFGFRFADKIIGYINGQEKYHQKISFKEEYIDLLKFYHIEYDEKYLFDWIEEDAAPLGLE